MKLTSDIICWFLSVRNTDFIVSAVNSWSAPLSS